MAQSVFLLHKLHGGIPLVSRAHGSSDGLVACVSRLPSASPLISVAPGTRRALHERSASRIDIGAFRRHGRQSPFRRQSPFPSALRHLAAKPDKQATRMSREG